MENLRPAKVRQKLAQEKSLKSVHKNKGAEYQEKFNPYKTPLEKERFERYYNRNRNSYLHFCSVMKDMTEVYGGTYIENKTSWAATFLRTLKGLITKNTSV